MRNADGEVFSIPSLFLQKGPTLLLLDPIAYDVPGSDGVVDLYLMPTYDDMASLSLNDGIWMIHYPISHEEANAHAMNEPQSTALSQAILIKVLDSIADHAVPSV
jgi:hypothetical protein